MPRPRSVPFWDGSSLVSSTRTCRSGLRWHRVVLSGWTSGGMMQWYLHTLWNVSPFAACGVDPFSGCPLSVWGAWAPPQETLWVINDWLQPSKHEPNPEILELRAGTRTRFPSVEGRGLILNGACMKWMQHRLIKTEIPPVVFSNHAICPGGS